MDLTLIKKEKIRLGFLQGLLLLGFIPIIGTPAIVFCFLILSTLYITNKIFYISILSVLFGILIKIGYEKNTFEHILWLFFLSIQSIQIVLIKTKRNILFSIFCLFFSSFVLLLKGNFPFLEYIVFLYNFILVVILIRWHTTVFSFHFSHHMIFMILKNIVLFILFIFIFLCVSFQFNKYFWEKKENKINFSDDMNISDWEKISKDYTPLALVKFKKDPSGYIYLKAKTLWTFDGKKWLHSPMYHTISSVKEEHIKKTDDDSNQLSIINLLPSYTFLTYGFPQNVNVPNTVILNDQTAVFSSNKTNTFVPSFQNWTSIENKKEVLTKGEEKSGLQLPLNESNPETIRQAKIWRKRFKTDQEYIDFILNMFSQDFTYSLNPPKFDQNNPVDDFLFHKKIGFCIHYSSAFALLMRSAGIPTRIVNGFAFNEKVDNENTRLPYTDNTGTWLIKIPSGSFVMRSMDAHAWNEVWINNNWTRFDPTFQVQQYENTINSAKTSNFFTHKKWNFLKNYMQNNFIFLKKIWISNYKTGLYSFILCFGAIIILTLKQKSVFLKNVLYRTIHRDLNTYQKKEKNILSLTYLYKKNNQKNNHIDIKWLKTLDEILYQKKEIVFSTFVYFYLKWKFFYFIKI